MYRLSIRTLPAASLFGFGGSDTVTPTEMSMDAKSETAMDRLKSRLYADKYGQMSPDVALISNTTIFGIVCGAFYGGYMKSRTVYIDFIEKNKATAFQNHLEAKRALANRIYMSYGSGAFHSSWRVGLFSFIYVSSSCALSALRGKDGILEYAGAGAICGTLFRLHFGLVGAAVGCGLGCILGCIAGSFRAFAFWLTGINVNEVKELHQNWRNTRHERKMEDIGKARREDEMHVFIRARVEEEMSKGVKADDLGKVETDVSQSGSGSISNSVIDKIRKQDKAAA